jgi:uncharacterized membrane protein
MALGRTYGGQRRPAMAAAAVGVLVWLNQARRAFLAGRNLVDLSLLWSIHILLVTVTLLPGAPLDALRPVAAFVYLLFVPGLLLARLLRVYEEDPLAQLVTAVGLSLIYDMLLGLTLSGIPPAVIERPLDAIVFLPTSLIITAILSLLVRREQSLLAPFGQFARPYFLAWALLPLAAVSVALHVLSGGAIFWMVILLAVISATPLLLLLRRPTAAEGVTALFSIGLALAFHKYFVTPEFPGWDPRLEQFFASLVLDAGRWSPQSPHIYQTMLSITVLPAAAAEATGLGLESTFKILFGVILGFLPAAIFLSLRNLFSARWAFIGAFLYLGHYVFPLVMASVGKQTLATLLLVLLILTVTNDERGSMRVRVLQLILALAVVFSHYSTVPALVIGFGTSLVLTQLVKRRVPLPSNQIGTLPSLGLLLAVFIFTYIWFTWTSDGNLFTEFVAAGQRIAEAIRDELFLNRQVIGVSSGRFIPDGISYVMILFANWAVVLASLLGFALCLFGILQRDRFRAYLAVLGGGGVVLGALFAIIPQTTESLVISRTFMMTLLWLLPLSIFGMKWIFRTSRLWQKSFAVPIVGVALFIYIALGTGLATHLMGDRDFSHALDPRLTLNSYDQATLGFVSLHRGQRPPIYSDGIGRQLFLAAEPSKTALLSSLDLSSIGSNEFYLYLRKANLSGRWTSRGVAVFATHVPQAEESEMLELVASLKNNLNLVYASEGAELYYSTSGQLSQQP